MRRAPPPAPAERMCPMPQFRPALLGALLLALPAAPALADTTVGCVTTAWKNAGAAQCKKVNFWPNAER